MSEIATVWFTQRALVVHGAGILAVRIAEGPVGGMWDLPGGRLGPAESVDDALRREVFEETGVRVRPGATLEFARWSVELDDGAHDVVAAYRLAEVVGTPEPTLAHQDDGDNHDAVRWLSLDGVARAPWLPALAEPVRRWADHFLAGEPGRRRPSRGSARRPG